MGLRATLQGRFALTRQAKGDLEGAKALYEKAIAGGLMSPRPMLAYSILLLRGGEYEAAKSVLVKTQKIPGLAPAQKQQIYVNYATCCYKEGDVKKAVGLLEKQHARQACGLVYETLGFLYVEAGDTEKALAYNTEACDYDDEDPIVLDNMGQTYYRLLGDKEKAKVYFDKAIQRKPGQIDTLYFLSEYDIQAGKPDDAREKLEKALEGRFSPLNYATREKVQARLDALPPKAAEA